MLITRYLQKKKIPFSLPGKNVSRGWIGIRCIFCDDHSNHLGINLSTGWFHCLRCHTKGHFRDLIKYFEDPEHVGSIVSSLEYEKLESRPENADEVILPEFLDEITSYHMDYLKSRGFDEMTVKKFNLKSCPEFGEYAWRIFIPFYLNGELVTFTTRAITDKGLRYKACPVEKSKVSLHDTLYNIDTVNDVAILVEGPTDVWRIGDGAVGICTNKLNDRQISLLISKRLKKLFIMLDSGELEKRNSLSIANFFVTMIDKVEILELDDGDPASSLSFDDVVELRSYCFG